MEKFLLHNFYPKVVFIVVKWKSVKHLTMYALSFSKNQKEGGRYALNFLGKILKTPWFLYKNMVKYKQ